MIAAVLTQPNQPLELREIEWCPLQYGQVLVKVLSTGICGAQMSEIRGEKGNHFPRLLGHEACVEVVERGPGPAWLPMSEDPSGCRPLKVGTRCVAHWRKGVGVESDSPAFLLKDEPKFNNHHTAGQITTFSQYSVVSQNRLTPVPDETPVELCALLGCGLSTALGTMENEANLRLGESVLIIGCGGLGLNLILAAKLRGASMISATDVTSRKEYLALKMGANYFGYAVKQADVVIDTTGDSVAISLGLECLAPSGRFIMVGQPKPGVPVELTNALRMFEGSGKTILATQGGRFSPSLDIPRYVNLHRAGLLNLDGLISHRFPLKNINDGLELVRQGQAGRILIDCAE